MTLCTEALFQRARTEHPKAERIEIKYLVAGEDCPIDDGFHSWSDVTGIYADYIGNHVRVVEMALCHYVNGFVFVPGADVTKAAEAEIDAARRRDEDGYSDPHEEHRLTAGQLGLSRVA